MNTTAIKLKSLRDAPRRVQSMMTGANFIADRKFSGNLDLNSLSSSPSSLKK